MTAGSWSQHLRPGGIAGQFYDCLILYFCKALHLLFFIFMRPSCHKSSNLSIMGEVDFIKVYLNVFT